MSDGLSQFFNQPGWSAAASEGQYKNEQLIGLRCLGRIKICRIPLITGGVPGHYWVQILHADEKIESYGWYPAEATGFRSMLGFPGCINGDSPERRRVDRETLKDEPNTSRVDLKAGRGIGHSPYPYDPHHDDVKTKHKHHPYLFLEDGRSEEQVIEEIRNFAKTFKSHWNWAADEYTEENCHTFLFKLLHQVNLADIHILNDGHFSRYLASAKRNNTPVTYPSVGNTIPVPVPVPQFDYKNARAIADKMKKVKANAERLDRVINRK